MSKKTPEVVGKLISAFANGFNISQACVYAEIHRDTYYDWCETDKNFSDKMNEAQTRIGMRARQVVADAINNAEAPDLNAAKWWLEKRDADFKQKVEMTMTPDEARLGDIIKELTDDPASKPDQLPDNSEDATAQPDQEG
jgi:hypothetical protein